MASERKKSKKKVEFSQTDYELQQLLQAPLGYKAKCEFDAKNGEKKRQKYENIFDILMQKYPDEKEKYSNKKKMNKKRVAAKLKSMRYGFKKSN